MIDAEELLMCFAAASTPPAQRLKDNPPALFDLTEPVEP
jgi:hypothetical protein